MNEKVVAMTLQTLIASLGIPDLSRSWVSLALELSKDLLSSALLTVPESAVEYFKRNTSLIPFFNQVIREHNIDFSFAFGDIVRDDGVTVWYISLCPNDGTLAKQREAIKTGSVAGHMIQGTYLLG